MKQIFIKNKATKNITFQIKDVYSTLTKETFKMKAFSKHTLIQ